MCCDNTMFIIQQNQQNQEVVVEQPPTWVNYAAATWGEIVGEPTQMSIQVWLDVAQTTTGIPVGIQVGDNIRFEATGEDIPVIAIIQNGGIDAIVVEKDYATYANTPNVYYLQD